MKTEQKIRECRQQLRKLPIGCLDAEIDQILESYFGQPKQEINCPPKNHLLTPQPQQPDKSLDEIAYKWSCAFAASGEGCATPYFRQACIEYAATKGAKK